MNPAARLALIGLFPSFVSLTGCRPDAPPVRPDVPVAIASPNGHGAQTQPQFIDPAPAPPGTAQAVAQRAANFAQTMGPAIQRRTNSPLAADPQEAHAGDSTKPPRIAMSSQGRTSPAGGDVAVPDSALSAALKEKDAVHASASVPPTNDVAAPAPAPTPRTTTATAPDTDALMRRFAQRVKEYPQDVSAHLDYQLLKFLQDETVPEIRSLTPLQSEDRELISSVMDALSNFRNGLRSDNNMLLSKKIHPLVELADRLRSQAELSVPTVALCTDVKAFGIYNPVEPRFPAGKSVKIVVYCEVENFSTLLNDQKLWETKLTQDVVLYGEASGQEVWREKRSSYDDLSHTRRHDFFLGKIIALPANLTIGRYLLKVSIEDQQVKHIAENVLPVEIVAQ